MKLLSRLLNTLPKRFAAGALVVLAVALPVAVSAAQTVNITATTGVANVTAGDTSYNSSVNAAYDQVVKVQVTYTNAEAPGSGLNANGVHMKITVPTGTGTTQTVTSTVAGSNTNTVNGQAVVNLAQAGFLQYIPGSAQARVTETNGTVDPVVAVPDGVVTGDGFLVNNGNPCQSAAVAIEARVMVPGVKIVKEVEGVNQSNAWTTQNTANPGDILKYRLTYQNTGNIKENAVVIRDNLPAGMALVPGTTKAYTSTTPNGSLDTTDSIAGGGLDVGNYLPGAIAYVVFEAQVPSADKLACGENTFRNVGVVRPQGMQEYWNFANTTANKTCQNTPTFSCDAFHVSQNGHSVTVDQFRTTASNGATFTNVVINWGDNSTPLTTNTPLDKNHPTTHGYGADGPYTLVATAHFDVNGQDKTASGGSCTQTVSFTIPPSTPPSTPPAKLVNAGPGDTLAVVALTVVGGAVAHSFYARRLVREQ